MIGIGVGVGVYVLVKFVFIFFDLVEGLVLVNIDFNGKGWIDWVVIKFFGLISILFDMVFFYFFS